GTSGPAAADLRHLLGGQVLVGRRGGRGRGRGGGGTGRPAGCRLALRRRVPGRPAEVAQVAEPALPIAPARLRLGGTRLPRGGVRFPRPARRLGLGLPRRGLVARLPRRLLGRSPGPARWCLRRLRVGVAGLAGRAGAPLVLRGAGVPPVAPPGVPAVLVAPLPGVPPLGRPVVGAELVGAPRVGGPRLDRPRRRLGRPPLGSPALRRPRLARPVRLCARRPAPATRLPA